MQKFEANPPSSRPRDLGRSLRADRNAVGVFAAMLALFLAATLLMVGLVLQPYLQRLALVSIAAAETVAQGVADDIENALVIGIPLNELVGVDAYLDGVLRGERLVSSIELRGPQEVTLIRTVLDGEPASGGVRVGVMLDGRVAANVIVTPSTLPREEAAWRLLASALAASIVFATLAAVVFRIALLERTNLPLARLGSAAHAVARGTVAEFTTASAGPARQMGRSAARLLQPLARERRQIGSLTDEVRALDTAGLLSGRLRAALRPLEGLRFGRAHRRRSTTPTLFWWPLAAASLLLATRPLVASFAADRVAAGTAETLAASAALTANACGAILGLFAAQAMRARPSRAAIACAMIIAGAATASTYGNRDVFVFVGLQALIGACGVFAVALALGGNGRSQRMPWRIALVFLAALAIGPALGTLIAEAVGRRSAFLTIGILVALAGVPALFLARLPRIRARPERADHFPRNAREARIAMAAAGAAGCAMVDIMFPLENLSEDYAGLALSGALGGLAALTVPALAGRFLDRLSAPVGAAIAAAGPVSLLLHMPALLCAPLFGLGLGIVATTTRRSATGATRALAFLAGILAGALVAALGALVLGGPEAGAAAALVLAAWSLLDARLSRTRAAAGPTADTRSHPADGHAPQAGH